MITLFKVSDIGFIANDSDKEIFRFIPANDLKKKYDQKEILTRIFSEDVTVDEEPIPPEYTPIIQQLIDTEPQPETAADIAKILSLYDPSDISDILKTLINTKPQPTTDEQILQIVKGYPYLIYSAIYDYKYLSWSKIGTGTITRDGDHYIFDNTGVQYKDIANDIITDEIHINFKIKILSMPTANIPIFRLYNNLTNNENGYPFIGVNFTSSGKFTLMRRQVTNATIENATEIDSVVFKKNEEPNLKFGVMDNGEQTYLDTDFKFLRSFSTKTTIKPKNIRVMVNNSSTQTTYGNNSIELKKFQIMDGYTNIISQWNK